MRRTDATIRLIKKAAIRGVTAIIKGHGTGSGRGLKNFSPPYSFRNPLAEIQKKGDWKRNFCVKHSAL